MALGGAVIDGVLTESPGLNRIEVDMTIAGNVATLRTGLSFGPFAGPGWGSFAAFGLFNAIQGGVMFFYGTFPPVAPASGQYLSYLTGVYTLTPAPAVGVDVLTLGGVALTLGGQPLQVP